MYPGSTQPFSDSYSAAARLHRGSVDSGSSLGSAIAAVLPPIALMAICLVHQLLQ